MVNGVDLRDLRHDVENGYRASSATVLDLIDEVIRRRADDLALHSTALAAEQGGVTVDDVRRRLESLLPCGVEVVGSVSTMLEWSSEPQMALNQRTPCQMLVSDAGMEQVRALLGRLDYGVYT